MVMTMAAADGPEVTQQLELAKVSINANRKDSVVQNRAGTDVEIATVVGPVSNSHKGTPQTNPTLFTTKPPAPSFERFTSQKRILIRGTDGAVELQFH